MVYILSWTTKKHQNTRSRPLHSKLKKIQGLFKTGGACLRTSQKSSDDMKVSEDVAYMRQVLRSCCKLKVNQSWHACVS